MTIEARFNRTDWKKMLSYANVEKQVKLFNNFVRSKVITVVDKDPPWINKEIKCKIKSKTKTFQLNFKNGRNN